MGVLAATIFSLETAPLPGAFGFEGAMAVTGPKALQATEKGCVVRVYCAVDSARDQLTGRGVTAVGADEKVPVATKLAWPPFETALIVIDCSCRFGLVPQDNPREVTSRRQGIRNFLMASSPSNSQGFSTGEELVDIR